MTHDGALLFVADQPLLFNVSLKYIVYISNSTGMKKNPQTNSFVSWAKERYQVFVYR